MPHKSSIPLFGLPHKCNVVRRKFADDGAGGVSDDATPVTLYTNRKCRISALDPDDEELKGMGFDAQRHRKVVMVYSPKIIRKDEFVKVPWDVPPNVAPPEGLADGFAPSYVIVTPAGSKTLVWSVANDRYQDSADEYRVEWTGAVWRFSDTIAPLTHDFTGFTETQNIFKRPWDTEVGASYGVTRATADAMDFRIVWHTHQIDETGGVHHTSLIVELEDDDD